ncbi:MAG: ribonuclease R [Cytophagaceae bacterium]|jgi:ribonuclease R|nr:ribonuclease R [Cytophagaceae bacterium]
MKKEKQKGNELLLERLLKFFNNSKKNAFSAKDLIKKLDLKRKDSKEGLVQALRELIGQGKIIQSKNGLFKSAAGMQVKILTGRLDHVSPRFAYVIPESGEGEDIWIDNRYLNGAIDGDIVRVSVFDKQKKMGVHDEGEVIEIVERRRFQFVGKVQLSKRFAFVIPDSKKIYFDIFVPSEVLNGALENQKVVVEVEEWPGPGDRNPVGKVLEVLGNAGENEVEMHAIMAEYGLPFEFSEEVERAAEKIDEAITPEEIASRRDFRNILTFTIDPYDAKDFDDALSIQYLPNGNVEIGVHIADVTHYIRPNTLLEKEAYRRATSVYLVDRCIPMLPEKLSNGLCSLRPKEEKLTFSAVFEMTTDGKVVKDWFGKTIIFSDRRFTYEEVQEILEAGTGEYCKELVLMNDIAKKMRTDRFKKGSISFETVEIKFKLDEKGKPLGVYPKVRKDAHKLIEEYMLLANKRVAEFVYNRSKSETKDVMVYRTHDDPDPQKLSTLANFSVRFGHKINFLQEGKIAETLNKLSDAVEGKPEQNVIQSLAIRCMAKAKYTTEENGHFGLAFPHYSHFTSPIRRYPDMMAHRLLFHYLNEGKSVDREMYEKKCEHSSEMEKLAAEAERASIKYKQVEFMQHREGEMDGVITGMIETGMFVEVSETKCEGMVRFSEMNDDYYEVDLDNYRIVGKRTQKVYHLGDLVVVKVRKTDLERRTIDLELVKKKTIRIDEQKN